MNFSTCRALTFRHIWWQFTKHLIFFVLFKPQQLIKSAFVTFVTLPHSMCMPSAVIAFGWHSRDDEKKNWRSRKKIAVLEHILEFWMNKLRNLRKRPKTESSNYNASVRILIFIKELSFFLDSCPYTNLLKIL